MVQLRAFAAVVSLLVLFPYAAGASANMDRERALERLEQAKAAAKSIPEQGLALADLAWPAKPEDPLVSSLARAQLVEFGSHGFPALHHAMTNVELRYTADVTAALIESRRKALVDIPPNLLPALEDAVWFGSSDARRLAIPELALYQYRPALLACIDAGLEDPTLLELVIRSVARMGDDRARFFLEEVLLAEDQNQAAMAAEAMATIGGRALAPLRDAVLSEDETVRGNAIAALLPVASIDDLAVLYEYLAKFTADDEAMIGRVRERAALLEQVLEERLDYDSASPAPRP
jgi:hypothetical protein